MFSLGFGKFRYERAIFRLDLIRCYGSGGKNKFSKNLRYKDGRQLALEHFDFYYKPIFRQRWPSVRLGLTSRSKTGAMVNNFGLNAPKVIENFETIGLVDLVSMLEECKLQRLERSDKLNSSSVHQRPQIQVETNDDVASEDTMDLQEKDTRSAATLNSFIMPTKFITREIVPQLDDDKMQPVLDAWSRDDVEFMYNDEMVYPKHLRIFVYPVGDIRKFDEPTIDDHSNVKNYQLLDVASLFPVLALDVRPNENVLDLCSSPGEKTLALLQTMVPCNLVCNDASAARINLLRHNLRTYIQSSDEVSERIRFTRFDATNPKNCIGVYDKVLVDVPNSEDRKSLRILDEEGNLFRRVMSGERLRLPDQQTEILIGGLKTLRRDGLLVYTTSTLSPNQNDQVVETALRRLRGDEENDFEFAICDLEPLARDFYNARVCRFASRQCRYGQLVVPYLPNNYGPVYTCKLKRIQ